MWKPETTFSRFWIVRENWEKKLNANDVVDRLNELNDENKELKLQLEAFKDKLCELGVSDVKLYGKRYYTGLEEWLE